MQVIVNHNILRLCQAPPRAEYFYKNGKSIPLLPRDQLKDMTPTSKRTDEKFIHDCFRNKKPYAAKTKKDRVDTVKKVVEKSKRFLINTSN